MGWGEVGDHTLAQLSMPLVAITRGREGCGSMQFTTYSSPYWERKKKKVKEKEREKVKERERESERERVVWDNSRIDGPIVKRRE